MPKASRSSFEERQRARDELREQVEWLVRPFLENLGSARALSVWLLLSNKEDHQLAMLGCNPLDYDLPRQNDKFRCDYAATKLLSKWDRLCLPQIDPKRAAIETALAAEKLCRKTNRRLRVMRIAGPLGPDNAWGRDILLRAQKIIREIVGGCPETLSFTGWSPGRTTLSFGSALSALEKFRVTPDATASAIGLAVKAISESPLWGQQLLQADGPTSLLVLRDQLPIARGNVAFTVPKNAKTDRFCCYEPHANIFLQLTAGRLLRRRLKQRTGIDLSDQSTNRRLALEGSKDGLTATIDLSSASDTISTELVKFLLPEEWYSLLDRIRSRETNYFGDWRRNHKFSSMGNGFTFELESIIFLAICQAVAQQQDCRFVPTVDGCVFGDDIVVPASIYQLTLKALNFAGFVPNTKKSFCLTPFRESCGLDATSGWIVTPPMIRPGSRKLNLAISFHNRIRDYCRNVWGWIPRAYDSHLSEIRKRYPGPIGPSFFGDGHYHVNLDVARPRRAYPTRGWEGWFFRTRRPYVKSRLTGFLGGSGAYDLRSVFGHSALLAATSLVRAPFQWQGRPGELPGGSAYVGGSRKTLQLPPNPIEATLLDSLREGGTYTDKTLEVLSHDWESLSIY